MSLSRSGSQGSAGHQPGTPTIGTATAGNGSATVTFTAPIYLGKPIGTTYIATAYNTSNVATGQTGTNSVSPITVSSLTNGTSYKFTVKLQNSITTSLESAYSNTVTPVAPPPIIPPAPPPVIPPVVPPSPPPVVPPSPPPVIPPVAPPIKPPLTPTPPPVAPPNPPPPIKPPLAPTPPPVAPPPVAPPPVACVQGDTLVRTSSGYVKARDLLVGQKLKSYSFKELPKTESSYDLMTWTSKTLSEDSLVETEIVAIKSSTRSITMMFNGDKTRRFSLEHTMFVKRENIYMFIQSGAVQIGDYLLYDSNGNVEEIMVDTIGFINEETDVYDISVDPYDLFIAGDLVVHNFKFIF